MKFEILGFPSLQDSRVFWLKKSAPRFFVIVYNISIASKQVGINITVVLLLSIIAYFVTRNFFVE